MNKEKESRDDIRQALAQHEKATRIDSDSLLDKFARIARGESVSNDQENGSSNSFIDTSADVGADAEHINFDDFFSKMASSPSIQLPKKVNGVKMPAAKKASKQPVDFGDLTPIIKDIATFKYSSSNRQQEIEAMRDAVQKQIRTLIASRIVENTRQVSSEIKQFYRIKEGGIRVEFFVLGKKYSMAALGDFRGNEYLCWNVSGNKVVGHVMRADADGDFEDSSEGFQIRVSEGWKE